jgi:hypothetical protein
MAGEFYIEGKKQQLDLTDIKNISTQLQNILTEVQNIVTQVENVLTQVQNTVTQVLNNVTQIQSDVTTIKTTTGEQLSSADFWSDPKEEAQINAAGITVPLPTLAITGIPAGATILRAIAMFKFRMLENTNAAANKLNGAQAIQVRVDTPGAWGDAINLVDDQFGIAASLREGGDVCIGSIDISGIVVGDDGYEFQWANGRADQDFLNFNDVQVGIRVWYSVPPPQ